MKIESASVTARNTYHINSILVFHDTSSHQYLGFSPPQSSVLILLSTLACRLIDPACGISAVILPITVIIVIVIVVIVLVVVEDFFDGCMEGIVVIIVIVKFPLESFGRLWQVGLKRDHEFCMNLWQLSE